MSYEGLLQGLLICLQPLNLFAMVVGTIIGIIIGVLPGLGSSSGMALLLPLVFFWPPETGLILLTALWMADQYGGAICSILLNIPGGAGAAFTCLDGHPMAQQGRSNEAIGLSMSGSTVGGIIGAVAFLFFAPPLASLVVTFGPPELFLVAVMGLTIIATLSQKDPIKGFIGGGLGLMCSFIGIDVLTGYPRYTFGSAYLMGGMDMTVIILGLFAIAKMVGTVESGEGQVSSVRQLTGSLWKGFWGAFKYPAVLIRSSIIGTLIGAVPAVGSATASALAYQDAMSINKHPENFGKGAPEGVLAPETANNAVQGGSLIPALTMGIPGSPSAAVFLAGLVMYGIRPGSDLFVLHPDLMWSIFWAMIIASFSFILFGVMFQGAFAAIVTAPLKWLMPILFALIIGGAYAANNSPLDLVALFVIGVIGYYMGVTGYSVVPFLLGFILGPMAAENFYRALLLSHGEFGTFFATPTAWILWTVVGLALFYPLFKVWRNARKARQAVS